MDAEFKQLAADRICAAIDAGKLSTLSPYGLYADMQRERAPKPVAIEGSDPEPIVTPVMPPAFEIFFRETVAKKLGPVVPAADSEPVDDSAHHDGA